MAVPAGVHHCDELLYTSTAAFQVAMLKLDDCSAVLRVGKSDFQFADQVWIILEVYIDLPSKGEALRKPASEMRSPL